jgi:hypothetical protein
MIFKSLDEEERMSMKKRAWLGAVFLLTSALAAADWQAETARRIVREGEYPLLIERLQKEFPAVPEGEKAAVCLIIGYCQSRLNDPQAELFWMNKYLEEFRAADVKIGFIPAALRQKIYRFKLSWQRDFPVVWELAPVPEHPEFAFFAPPAELKLRIQVSLPCDFQLLTPEGALLARGVLGQGVETVKVPLAEDFVRVASHSFRLQLTLRQAPEKTVEKYFSIDLQYLTPEEVVFDPLTAAVSLKGRDLQPESRRETQVVSQSRSFDKPLFKKTVLKNLLIGAVFFVVNATLITSTIDNPDSSLFAKSTLYGTRRVFTLAGIGFSLSALLHLPKVFKRERVVKETTLDLPEARAANEALKRDLARERDNIRVRLALKRI